MSFVSVSFFALYLVAIALRVSVGASKQSRFYLDGLYLLSLIFYGWHVPQYLVLILVSTLTDYWAALALTRPGASARRRRVILAVSLLVNLGLLGTFKYAGFFHELVSDITALIGIGALRSPALEILLPIGISFYTFQSMSYTIDVYRGEIRPERNFRRFGLYVAFFPQLVAGPIVRAGEFLYQLPRRRENHLGVFLHGGALIVRGLFLKLVIADNLGAIVDEFWPQAVASGASPALAGSLMVFYSCQLFCDFAGYTDIARGLAYQLGFRLPINFNAPFIATSFREFWQRWHITLSQWMRDYVYVPLGGNRAGRARAVSNLVLVMLISGLWHGASLTFLIWGALHGFAAASERLLGLSGVGQPRRRGLAGCTLGAVWFLVVQGVWIGGMAIFRSASGSEAAGILGNLLSGLTLAAGDPLGLPEGAEIVATAWWFTLPVWLLHLRALVGERTALGEPRVLERALVTGVMAYAVLTLYATARGFIYFQF